MGMGYLCPGRISDPVSCVHQPPGINHIFIKYGMAGKAFQFIKNIPPVGGTYIGCEKGFDSHGFNIPGGFYTGFLRVIKRTGITFNYPAPPGRDLPGIGHAHLGIHKGGEQPFCHFFIHRKGIIGHHDKIRRQGQGYPVISCPPMVKVLFRDMLHCHVLIFIPKIRACGKFVKINLFRIDQNNTVDRQGLCL
ncbi:hypothetical protein IMSAGC019_03256 [Lachnospiraceae bacterium]|nr:hypothetical protein IMSAGC019_03256 [Lachnospiraceae bacterium]